MNNIILAVMLKSDPEFITLYNAIAAVINFCWNGEKGWIGTETIRQSRKFLELMSNLSDALKPFEPTEEGESIGR
jgi:hypothetical protein